MTESEISRLNSKTYQWLQALFEKLQPHQRDWIGVYWKESYLHPASLSEDLVVGPYIGPKTPHERITPGNGLCSLAVELEQTINEANVKANDRFLACSSTTESEIIIPIRNSKDEIVGELDIDSNSLNAFDPETQKMLEKECSNFGETI